MNVPSPIWRQVLPKYPDSDWDRYERVVLLLDECPTCGGKSKHSWGWGKPASLQSTVTVHVADPEGAGDGMKWDECGNGHAFNVRGYPAKGEFVYERFLVHNARVARSLADALESMALERGLSLNE